MAAGTLPRPGTDLGPCDDDCQHRDWAATREQAATECIHCDEPIGYDTPFIIVERVSEPGANERLVLAHRICELEALDAMREATTP